MNVFSTSHLTKFKTILLFIKEYPDFKNDDKLFTNFKNSYQDQSNRKLFAL